MSRHNTRKAEQNTEAFEGGDWDASRPRRIFWAPTASHAAISPEENAHS